MSAWTERPPIEAECGCRVDFLALGDGEYAFVLDECELGVACPVARFVVREIDRTRASLARGSRRRRRRAAHR